MAVTDLTNTKWLIKDNVSLDYDGYNINFTSNSTNYTSFSISYGNINASWIEYDRNVVATIDNSTRDVSWDNNAYKTIEITGGADITDVDLISWLTANATQITSGGSMYLGTSTISKMYLGQNEVSKVYLGQDLVYEKQASGFTAKFTCDYGKGELFYIQINNDSTWYGCELISQQIVPVSSIPNSRFDANVLCIDNVSTIKIGTAGNPSSYSGPQYAESSCTGDFRGLTFTSTGSSNPAYATSVITMTQDSICRFYGND